MSNKKSNRVIKASCEFWLSRRPVGWTLEQHLENPTINAHDTESTKKLCAIVGDFLRTHGNPAEYLKDVT
jgi:hypothetical protein